MEKKHLDIQLNLKNGAETIFYSLLGQITHELLGSEEEDLLLF